MWRGWSSMLSHSSTRVSRSAATACVLLLSLPVPLSAQTPQPDFNLPPFLAPWDGYTDTPTPPAATVPPVGGSATPVPPLATPSPPGTPPADPALAGPAIVDVRALNAGSADAGCEGRLATRNVALSARLASSTALGTVGGMLDDAGWASEVARADQWYQLDLGASYSVAGVVLQGGQTPTGAAQAWVTSLQLQYSSDAVNWAYVDNAALFVGSASYADRVSVVARVLQTGRFVRILPKAWSVWPSLRAAVLVCETRAASYGGVRITFDRAVDRGVWAVNLPAAQRVETGYKVSEVFGVSGVGQTLGPPAGYSGTWQDARTYVITFNELFAGTIDPQVARIFFRESARLANAVSGVLSTRTGSTFAVPFFEAAGTPGVGGGGGGVATPVPATYPPQYVLLGTPSPSGDDDDAVGQYAAAAIVLLCVALCLAFAFFCVRCLRRVIEEQHHREYLRVGKEYARRRHPDGPSSIPSPERQPQQLPRRRDVSSPSPAPSPVNPISNVFPRQQQVGNTNSTYIPETPVS
eukprot:Rhum_TRINITY_DN13704_c14_g1::Rhum_TRINITY_DN13704_c14_g1_i1::g.63803::m.63803